MIVSSNTAKKMGYSVEEIRKKVADKEGAGAISRARLHQWRIKFHTEKRVTSYGLPNLGAPLTQFLAMAENILPHDKFVLFKTLFRFPLKSNEVTEVCFDKLSRIFDGRNALYQYQFLTPDLRTDWEEYRKLRLNEPQVWRTVGWDYFKTEINSVLVVDMPTEQEGELPEPYFYWLTIDEIVAYKAHRDGVMDYIAYRKDGKIIVIDDEYYRVWEDKRKTGKITGMPIIESRHDLGYCPARFFWNIPITLTDPDIKESPLTTVLEMLDWYEFFHISKRQLDLMGAYPILSGYEQSCDYSNAENGDYCDGGFLKDSQGHYKLDMAGLLMSCPKCGNKRIVGAGSFVEIPIPNDQEHKPDLRNPVQMLNVDRNSLDYNVDEERRLREEIITAVVGQDEIVTNRDAFNEQQVRANFESVTTVLKLVKGGFESAQQWVDETICRLRYGRYFIGARVDYGTEFYLYSATELRDLYKRAKDAGVPDSDLDMMQERITETEYRNDPVTLRRMRVLAEIEPYRHLSLNEVMSLYKEGLVSREDLLIKANFSNFVRRFERENTNVLSFGEVLPYDEKIRRINAELARYAGEATV